MHKPMRITLATTCALLAVAACTDPTVAPKSTVSSANIFNEEGSYQAFLARVYSGLAVTGQTGPAGNADISGIDEGFSQYLRLLWQMEELPTDEAAIAWNDQGVQELNTQLWSSSNQFLNSMYYRIYFQVGMANEFLRETSDAKIASRSVSAGTKAKIPGYRAEARFLRALSYWHGIDLFGPIPIVTEADAVGKTPPLQKTRAEVFNYVVSELTAIRNTLPPVGAAEFGRVDQGAVAMLLAKLYLNAAVYTGTTRWSEARTEAANVIAGPYSLDPNFLRLFSTDNSKSKEFIFAVPQDGKKIQSFGGTTFLVHASVGGSMNASSFGINGGWYGLRLKPEIVASFPNGGGPTTSDKRSSYFYSDGQALQMTNLTDFSKGIGGPKYRNVSSTGEPGQDQTFSDVAYPMFRLADAYLMYAEAVLRGGGGTRAEALNYMNALRARAYGNTSGNITDAQLTLDFILAERGRELLWEGHRRQDLVRYGQFSKAGVWSWKGNVVAGKVTEGFRDLYPLPASELIANRNLKQNAGY